MKKYYCDFCGIGIDLDKNWKSTIYLRAPFKIDYKQEYDLCIDCYNKIMKIKKED